MPVLSEGKRVLISFYSHFAHVEAESIKQQMMGPMGLAKSKEKAPWQISATFYNVEVIKSQLMTDLDW